MYEVSSISLVQAVSELVRASQVLVEKSNKLAERKPELGSWRLFRRLRRQGYPHSVRLVVTPHFLTEAAD